MGGLPLPDVPARIFGPVASLVREVCAAEPRLRGFQYSYMSPSDYQSLLQADLPAAMRVYWLEIIYRGHYAALTSLLRTVGWLESTIAAPSANRLLGFAASFRGLLEALADTHDAIGMTVVNLADSHALIHHALSGMLDAVAVHQDLEDALIHFTHARRLTKLDSAPPAHRAKPTTEYLKALEEAGGARVLDCYRALCEVTHPAAPSTFLYSETDGQGSWRIGSTGDGALIDAFCSAHAEVVAPARPCRSRRAPARGRPSTARPAPASGLDCVLHLRTAWIWAVAQDPVDLPSAALPSGAIGAPMGTS